MSTMKGVHGGKSEQGEVSTDYEMVVGEESSSCEGLCISLA